MGVPNNTVRVLDGIIPPAQGITEVSTTPQARLGTRLHVGDRVFHYARASASVGGGTILCSPGPVASHQSGIFAVAAATSGAKTIYGTSSANVAANVYDEGYFNITSSAYAGQMYRIKQQDSGAAAFTIKLYDPLAQSINTGTFYALTKNPYNNVFVGSAAVDVPVGIAPCDVTSGGYFWLQTWGPANPLHVGATPASAAIALGTTGSVTAFSATGTLSNTGFALADYVLPIGKNHGLAATAGQANPVFLTIVP